MKILDLLLLLSLIVALVNSQCTPYRCANDVADGEPRIGRRCAIRGKPNSNKEVNQARFLKEALNDTDETIYMYPCEMDNLYCNVDVLDYKNEAFCEEINDELSAPGDTCKGDKDCKGGNPCVGGVCVGLDEGMLCTSEYDCGPNLQCLNGRCARMSGLGESCNSEKDCNFMDQCYQGKCIKIGSLPDGTHVRDIFVALECKSGYSFYGEADLEPYCTSKGAKKKYSDLKRNIGGECNVEYQFADTGTKANLPFPATCGFNKDSHYYCPKSVPGDDGWRNAAKGLIKAITAYDEVKCHQYSNIFKCKDLLDKDLLKPIMKYIWKILEFGLYQDGQGIINSDKCILETVSPLLAEYKEIAGGDYAFLFSAYSYLSIFTFITFCLIW